jgi:hypothetical protein
MPSRPISRSSSFVPSSIADYGAMSQSWGATEVLMRPRAQPEILSFRRRHPAPKPTLAAQIVAARPHQALDHAFEQGTKVLGRKTQQALLKSPIVDRDTWLLALMITTCAGVGGANLMHEMGRRGLDWAVEKPVRRGIDAADRHGGPWASVPLSLGYDGARFFLALVLNGTCCLTGVIVGAAAVVGTAPLLLAMPAHLRTTLADGLRSYLTLQQRLAAVEQLMEPAAFAPPRRLTAALDQLQRHIDALSHRGRPLEEAPPAHMHFHFIKDLMAQHPNIARRLGLPRFLSPERLLPIKERLLRHANQRRRSDELMVASRSRRFMLGTAS